MKEYQYRKIDAFTVGQSLGNPAACIYLEDKQDLTDFEMLEIAKQHKGFVSEVVYCKQTAPLTFHLTYYSSECEVDFCGHGTIACMYNLIKETPELMEQKEIVIQTNKKGSLKVFNEIKEHDSVYITAPAPKHIRTNLNKLYVSEKLAIDNKRISDDLPLDIIDAGLKTLIFPISKLSDEISIYPNEQTLKSFCLSEDIDIILVFSMETNDEQNIAHTRVFAPKFGYLEDPATGSGNSAFGYYMLENNLWNGKPVSIEQGGEDRIFNVVKLQCNEGQVIFGGKATTRINGIYHI